jgi:hypothetical protein
VPARDDLLQFLGYKKPGPKGSSVQPTGPNGPGPLWNLLQNSTGTVPNGSTLPPWPVDPITGQPTIGPIPVMPPGIIPGQGDPTVSGGSNTGGNPPSYTPPIYGQNQGAAPNSGPGAMANDFGSWYDGLSAQDKAAIQGSGKGFFAYWLDLQNQAYGAATNTNMGPQGSNAAGPGGFNYAGAGLPQPNTQPYYPTSGKGPGYSPTNPGSVTQIAPPGGNNPVYTNPFLNYQTGGYGLPDASNSHTGPVAPPTTEPKPGDGSQGWTVPGGPINLPTYGDLGMTQPLAANQPGYNAPNGPVPPGGIDYGNYGGGSVTNLVKNFRGPVPPGNLPKFPGLPNRTIKTKKKNNLNQLTSFLLGY